ncbi:MAG TPA: Pvc16 family protein [Chloroflexia bacterium]|jgi:hypothetical protein
MINDLDETIKKLLVDGVPLDTSEIDVVFDAPTSEWKSSLARPTVNCYLYHIIENHELRRTDWELNRNTAIKQNGSSLSHSQTRKRMPFRIDLSYMITTWANVMEDEHRLLWRILAALMKHNNIPTGLLQGDLATQEWPVHMKVAQPESVFKNPSDFWSGMETHVKPGVNCIVTLALDPDMFLELPIVLTRRVRVHPMDNVAAGYEVPTVQFGGWVVMGENYATGARVPGARVQIVEHGIVTQTDEAGRFKFDHIPHGRYTLRANTEDGGEVERKINVPGDDYDLLLSGRGEREASSRDGGGGDPAPATHDGGKSRRR